MKYRFALCEGRHPIPGVERAIFPTTINPLDLAGMNALANNAIPADCTDIQVYVTGLTVAMLTVVSVCMDRGISLTAMHFDRESGTYYPQEILRYTTCPWCGEPIEAHNYCCPNCGGN